MRANKANTFTDFSELSQTPYNVPMGTFAYLQDPSIDDQNKSSMIRLKRSFQHHYNYITLKKQKYNPKDKPILQTSELFMSTIISDSNVSSEVEQVQPPVELEEEDKRDIFMVEPYRPARDIVTDVDRKNQQPNVLGQLILKKIGTKKGKDWHHDDKNNTIVIED